MYLSKDLQEDFQWWETQIVESINSIKAPTYVKKIYTDASLSGWDAVCEVKQRTACGRRKNALFT